MVAGGERGIPPFAYVRLQMITRPERGVTRGGGADGTRSVKGGTQILAKGVATDIDLVLGSSPALTCVRGWMACCGVGRLLAVLAPITRFTSGVWEQQMLPFELMFVPERMAVVAEPILPCVFRSLREGNSHI